MRRRRGLITPPQIVSRHLCHNDAAMVPPWLDNSSNTQCNFKLVLLFGAIVVDSLDPIEQNFLFDTDDNSLGGFANMFEDETDNSQAIHSLLSGS
ncbi:hypothetical protein Tco_0084493 [Tanacetum coccineum]